MALLTLQPPNNFIMPPKQYSGQDVRRKNRDDEAREINRAFGDIISRELTERLTERPNPLMVVT
jgi:hypothetical protein